MFIAISCIMYLPFMFATIHLELFILFIHFVIYLCMQKKQLLFPLDLLGFIFYCLL